MKFAQKLSCTIILLVAASFSVGGFLLVWGNFNDSLDEAEAQAERWHLMQRYAMEAEVLTRMAQGTEITDETCAAIWNLCRLMKVKAWPQ